MTTFSHGDQVIRKGEKDRDRYGFVDEHFSRYVPTGKVYVFWNDTFRISCIGIDKIILLSDLPQQEEILDRDVKHFWTEASHAQNNKQHSGK